MSNPLANLKKSKKTPLLTGGLQSGRNIPYRTPDRPEYSVDENKLLDEITNNMATQKLKDLRSSMIDPVSGGLSQQAREGNVSHRSTPVKTVPNDNDLLSIMMTRLTHLEQRLQYQAKEMAEKDKKIKILEEKLRIMQRSKENMENGGTGRNAELERKCLLLQQQIQEMESFLSDYGMVWVGEESDPSSDVYNDNTLEEFPVGPESASYWNQEKSFVNGDGFQMDYDLVIRNVAELNTLAGDGIAQVHKTTDGARLKMQDPISLTLYANGIMMFSGPFRPFTDPETQSCMRDLMDGYFPSELQGRYPDGIPISVTDKRNVLFKDKHSDVFRGSGQVLGGNTKPSRLVPSNIAHEQKEMTGKLSPEVKPVDIKESPRYVPGSQQENKATMMEEGEDGQAHMDVESDLPGPKLTVEQFLNKLPQAVIKQGRVIDIRNSVGETMQGGNSSPRNQVSVIETDAVKEMKSRLQLAEEKRPPSAKDLTTLRIKSEKGDHTYILKMKFTDTIGDVRSYLDNSRPAGSGDYLLMSAFPRKTFENTTATLKQCGLVPNAALHLKHKN